MIPTLQAEELLERNTMITAGNIKSIALRAGYSLEDADALENRLLMQEMRNVPSK